MGRKKSRHLNFKISKRRDFWNMDINPITGFSPVINKGTSGKNAQPDLVADYGPTAGII